MGERGDDVERTALFSRVSSDDLPDWAEEPDDDGSDGGGSGWVDDLTGQEERTDDPGHDPGESTSGQRAGLTVTVGRTECKNCGTSTVRGHHPGCEAPIIHLGGQWTCGECGSRVAPPDSCFDCGAGVDRDRVDIPIDLSLSADRTAVERAVHEATNRRRTDHGLGTLEYSHHLSAIALQHSRDMAERDFFSHTSPDGDDAGDRYRRFEHDDRSSGENIALTHPDHGASVREAARSVVEGWMNSKGHRENILRDRFAKEGIGVYITPEGAMYTTQNFY